MIMASVFAKLIRDAVGVNSTRNEIRIENCVKNTRLCQLTPARVTYLLGREEIPRTGDEDEDVVNFGGDSQQTMFQLLGDIEDCMQLGIGITKKSTRCIQ